MLEDNAQPEKTLWILACENGWGIELTPLYASSEEDAELQARIWVVQQQAVRPLVRLSLRNFPGGFKMGQRRELPGRI